MSNDRFHQSDDDLSSKELIRKNSREAYTTVVRLNESCLKKDWRSYAKLLSDSELTQGVQEHETETKQVVSSEMYRDDIVPKIMSADRGVYNNLVDYEVVTEEAVSDYEVFYVFRYTYLMGESRYTEDEKVWAVKQKTKKGGYEWKVSFHGSEPNSSSCCSCLIQ